MAGRSLLARDAERGALAALDYRSASFEETVRALERPGSPARTLTHRTRRRRSRSPTERSAAADRIGAANTLTFAADGTIGAENTDAPGLLLAALGIDVAGLRAQVLGRGSARAAVWALLDAAA